MFDLDVVDLLWCRNVDFGGSELCNGIELWILCSVALANHLGFPTFMVIHGAPSEGRMTRCMCPLCCFACCQTENGPWQADSWLPCCPLWSAVICCTVSQPLWHAVWTLTGYFGLKFQHPSVKPNKRYLKGQQKPREKHRKHQGSWSPVCLSTWVKIYVAWVWFYSFGSSNGFDLSLERRLWPWKWTQRVLLNSKKH